MTDVNRMLRRVALLAAASAGTTALLTPRR